VAAGILEIRWTFDPLQALNARFNIHKLGAIARGYEENIYGRSSSPLHQGLPTDRLVAEWHLESGRDESLILRDLDRMPCINPPGGNCDLTLQESPLLLEIPWNAGELRETDIEGLKAWQSSVRDACIHYFSRGYAATDFLLIDQPRRQAFYVLELTSSDVLRRRNSPV
jgi:predicted GNAT superfamily acetyltransferase